VQKYKQIPKQVAAKSSAASAAAAAASVGAQAALVVQDFKVDYKLNLVSSMAA